MVDLQATMQEEAANMWVSVCAIRGHANEILLLLDAADSKDSELQDSAALGYFLGQAAVLNDL